MPRIGMTGPSSSEPEPPIKAGHAELEVLHAPQVEPAFIVARDRAPLGRGLLGGIGIDCGNDLASRGLAPADGGQQILHAFLAKLAEEWPQARCRRSLPHALEGRFHDVAAKRQILLADGLFRRAPDGGAGLAGNDGAFPGRGRRLGIGEDDLDLVAVLELVHQRHVPAVDLGADAAVADIGVDGIGEIDGVRAARQRDEAALRREAEHLIEEQLKLGVLQELLGIVAFEKIVDQLAKPLIGGAFAEPRRFPRHRLPCRSSLSLAASL